MARMTRVIAHTESAVVILIMVMTLIAVVLEVVKIWERQDVVIADILLLFLYTEVLSMARAFYDSRRVPVLYPVLIAITALSRLIVLQSKEMDPESILYEAVAVLLLGITVLGLRFSDRFEHGSILSQGQPEHELDQGDDRGDRSESGDRPRL